MKTRSELRDEMAMLMGGRTAEELTFGDPTTGAQNDIEQATNLARVMVCELGMSEKVGPIKYTEDDENPFLGREFRLGNLSQRTLEMIDEEVRSIIEDQYAKARALLVGHRAGLDAVAAALLKHETLSGEEVAAIVRGDNLEEYREAQRRRRKEQEKPARRPAAEQDPGTAGADGSPGPAKANKPDVGLSGA